MTRAHATKRPAVFQRHLPTRIVDSDGRSFEFDHAWAENFTRLTCDGQRGLAHFECVVIQEAQEWTTNPGRTPAGGPHE